MRHLLVHFSQVREGAGVVGSLGNVMLAAKWHIRTVDLWSRRSHAGSPQTRPPKISLAGVAIECVTHDQFRACRTRRRSAMNC